MLSRILELDFLSDRFRLTLDEVTGEEVRGLMVLREEREKARAEK